MSENEYFTGELEKLAFPHFLTWTEKISMLKRSGLSIDESFSDEESGWLDSDDVVILKNEWYKVVSKNIHEPNEDIFEAEKKKGKIKYTVKYYNGSCGFSEALEYAIESMEGDNGTD